MCFGWRGGDNKKEICNGKNACGEEAEETSVLYFIGVWVEERHSDKEQSWNNRSRTATGVKKNTRVWQRRILSRCRYGGPSRKRALWSLHFMVRYGRRSLEITGGFVSAVNSRNVTGIVINNSWSNTLMKKLQNALS